VLVREENERDAFDPGVALELREGRAERDRGGRLDRIAVDAGRDRGECDRAAPELGGDLERAAVT